LLRFKTVVAAKPRRPPRAEISHRAGMQPSNINDLYVMTNFILKTAAISMVFVRQQATLM
jgi:hypothetical protein